MFRILSHNFLIKIICLMLATGLWIYVANKDAKVDTFPGSIPLKVRNAPQNLVVVKDVSNVSLRVVAEKGVWNKLSSDSFEAYIDLSGLNEGVHELPINAKSNVDGVQIVEIKPDKVMVRLEILTSKTIPVELKIEGSAAEGYTTGDAQISPQEVDVSGAKSVIDQISQAVATIKLNNESDKIEKAVPVFSYDSESIKIENVAFKPSEVQIILPIIRGGTTKTVGITVNLTGAPKSGYWVNDITVSPSTVLISGEASKLNQIDYIETLPINIDGSDSDQKQKISLDLPNGISLIDQAKDQVNVEIKISAIASQKEVVSSFNYQNLANNLSVTGIDPNSVKVLVSGSSDILGTLDSNKVMLNLDLAKYNSVGTYAIDIAKNNFSIPDGIQIISIVPSSIRVTLGNK